MQESIRSKLQKGNVREHRITMEVMDAGNEHERAMGWYY